MRTALPSPRRRALLAGAAALASAWLPAGAYGISRNRYGITVISLSAHGNGCACAVP